MRRGGRVLTSTEEDNVFIIYTDHGAPGYVTFPSGPAMHAGDLNDALVKMQAARRYVHERRYRDEPIHTTACVRVRHCAHGVLTP